jgi:hypothetical protein
VAAEDEVGPRFVIERRDEIEVYAGEKGHVCIKQEGALGEEDDLVILHPEDVPRLISFLQRVRQQAVEIREMLDRAEET